MKKTFPLQPPGKNPARVLDALKFELRKYTKRERAKPLPADTDFWDFDCRIGASEPEAALAHVAELGARLDALATTGATQAYVEILARAAKRKPRPQGGDTPERGSALSAALNVDGNSAGDGAD
jgi:hypothetical protein